MSKVVLMAILFMTIAIPMRHVRAQNPERALKRAMVEFCWFNLVYVLAIVFLVPRLL